MTYWHWAPSLWDLLYGIVFEAGVMKIGLLVVERKKRKNNA